MGRESDYPIEQGLVHGFLTIMLQCLVHADLAVSADNSIVSLGNKVFGNLVFRVWCCRLQHHVA